MESVRYSRPGLFVPDLPGLYNPNHGPGFLIWDPSIPTIYPIHVPKGPKYLTIGSLGFPY